MMMIEINDHGVNLIPLFLFLGVVVLIGLQMVWGARYRTDITNQRLRLQHLEKRLANAQKENKKLELGLSEIKRRQIQSDARAGAVGSRDDVSDLTYGLAVKLARRGVSVKELARTCGLTQGEAELLALANGIDKVRRARQSEGV